MASGRRISAEMRLPKYGRILLPSMRSGVAVNPSKMQG